VTRKATDGAVQLPELVQRGFYLLYDRDLVVPWDVIRGLFGLSDLSFDNFVDGEENESCVFEKGLDRREVTCRRPLRNEVIPHAGHLAHVDDECVCIKLVSLICS